MKHSAKKPISVLLSAVIICSAVLASGCRDTSKSVPTLPISTPTSTQSTNESAASDTDSTVPASGSAPESPAAEKSVTESFEESSTSFEKCSETADYIINFMQERTGSTGRDLGYVGEWCACILSDLLISNGYNIFRAETPCDLAVTLLNNDYADFFCFRQKNYDSLVEWGLQNTELVKMMSREDYVPKRGDMICYLFRSEADRYNWSHIGIISEDYNGEYISSLEGNIDVDFAIKDPLLRYISTIRRPYNDTVVGIIRLK
ncbi:MAG: hypothetical protein K2J80_01430 [Oscillospiraceae bacterium]|nr:hypothetical protein [Oscillospiraceae bacterium]